MNAKRRMTDPHRYLLRMLVFLAVVGAVCALLFPGLSVAFRVNPPLNGLILGVFASAFSTLCGR
ncbi:MAG: hypothetical protein U1E38_00385 [Rhodospirillales bacterium]